MNSGSGNVPYMSFVGAFGIGGLTFLSQNQMGGVEVGWDACVPTETLVGLDTRFALEMVTEIGSSLTETDKIIGKQLNEIVMTESLGFCIFDQRGNRTLTLNA